MRATSHLGAGDLADDVDLDVVTVLEIVVILKAHPALETGRNLTNVVFESLQTGDDPIVNDDSIPEKSGFRTSLNHTLDDITTCNGPGSWNFEGRSNLSCAQDLLLFVWSPLTNQ